MNFGFPVGIKESEKINKYLSLTRELKKICQTWRWRDTNYSWCTWDNLQRFCKGAKCLGNTSLSRDHQDYIIIKIVQNIKKSPGDLRKIAVSQTPVINHQLTLLEKTLKEVNNNIKHVKAKVDKTQQNSKCI